MPWLIIKPIVLHTLNCLDQLLGESGTRNLVFLLVSVVVFWHLYTPVHELLHVAACYLGGGTVDELALKPQYGAHLLKKVFPFIVTDSDYAGQLTGFTTPNYWAFALVDFFPYLLSLGGVALAELCRRRSWTILFGLAVILIYIPVMSLPGDFYEAASLVTTQIAESMNPSLEAGVLISDDVFRSLNELKEMNLLTGTNGTLIVLGLVIGAWLVMMVLVLQVWVARRLFGQDFLESELAVAEKSATLTENVNRAIS